MLELLSHSFFLPVIYRMRLELYFTERTLVHYLSVCTIVYHASLVLRTSGLLGNIIVRRLLLLVMMMVRVDEISF